MKKLAIVTAILFLSGAGKVFAQSCDSSSGPYCMFYGCYWEYTEGRSCYETGGNLSEASTCFSEPGWEFGTGPNSWAQVTFTVTETEDFFEAFSEVYFDDPTNSSNNSISLWAWVDHPNTPYDDYYPLASHDGSMGDLTNCPRFGGSFPASQGDIVTVGISVGKASSNATITAERPLIANWDMYF